MEMTAYDFLFTFSSNHGSISPPGHGDWWARLPAWGFLLLLAGA